VFTRGVTFSLFLITSNSTTGTPLKGLIELHGKSRRTITSRAYVIGLGLAGVKGLLKAHISSLMG